MQWRDEEVNILLQKSQIILSYRLQIVMTKQCANKIRTTYKFDYFCTFYKNQVIQIFI